MALQNENGVFEEARPHLDEASSRLMLYRHAAVQESNDLSIFPIGIKARGACGTAIIISWLEQNASLRSDERNLDHRNQKENCCDMECLLGYLDALFHSMLTASLASIHQ